jgi:hypothetical protein
MAAAQKSPPGRRAMVRLSAGSRLHGSRQNFRSLGAISPQDAARPTGGCPRPDADSRRSAVRQKPVRARQSQGSSQDAPRQKGARGGQSGARPQNAVPRKVGDSPVAARARKNKARARQKGARPQNAAHRKPASCASGARDLRNAGSCPGAAHPNPATSTDGTRVLLSAVSRSSGACLNAARSAEADRPKSDGAGPSAVGCSSADRAKPAVRQKAARSPVAPCAKPPASPNAAGRFRAARLNVPQPISTGRRVTRPFADRVTAPRRYAGRRYAPGRPLAPARFIVAAGLGAVAWPSAARSRRPWRACSAMLG